MECSGLPGQTWGVQPLSFLPAQPTVVSMSALLPLRVTDGVGLWKRGGILCILFYTNFIVMYTW